MDADSTSAVLVEGAYRYARIPEWVLFHDELTATAKLAYAALDRYAGATAKAWPGITWSSSARRRSSCRDRKSVV